MISERMTALEMMGLMLINPESVRGMKTPMLRESWDRMCRLHSDSRESGSMLEELIGGGIMVCGELRSRGVHVGRHPFLDEVIHAVMVISEIDRRFAGVSDGE